MTGTLGALRQLTLPDTELRDGLDGLLCGGNGPWTHQVQDESLNSHLSFSSQVRIITDRVMLPVKSTLTKMRAGFCLSCGFVEAPEFYYHHHNSVPRQYLTHTLFRACVGRQLQPSSFAVKKTCKQSQEEKKKGNNYHKFHFIQTLSQLSSCFLTLHI